MLKLNAEHYPILTPLFTEVAALNLSVKAALAGDAPGDAWADDAEHPAVGLVNTSEGHCLAGDPARIDLYDDLRAAIPDWAFLQVFPAAWEGVLPRIWTNAVARPHHRQHHVLHELRYRDWRARLPTGFEMRQIDGPLLGKADLKHLDVIERWIRNNWRSQQDFLEHGFGFCAVEVATGAIVSCCVADCACGDQAEVGIKTNAQYRRRGLASAAVAAAVKHALAHGYREIGWHCVASNAGSIATAQKVGFVKERDYLAYSDQLPSENAGDLSPAEYAEWAEHYERAMVRKPSYAFNAACARALAGARAAALAHLRLALAGGERLDAEWLAHHWAFAAMQGEPEFQQLLASSHRNRT